MDMTAYVKPGTQERIGIVNDFVSEGLTKYIKTLIEEYNTIPWVDSKCGYACSDHTVSLVANVGFASLSLMCLKHA